MTSIVKELEEKAGIGRTTAKNRIRLVKKAMGINSQKYTDQIREKILYYAVTGEEIPANNIQVTPDSSFSEIRDAGYIHLNDADANSIAFAHDVAALKGKCKKVSGGSDFSTKAAEYWGLSKSKAYRLLDVGENTSFPKFGKALPRTVSALGHLAALTSDQIEEAVESGAIHPDMTANDAKLIKVVYTPAEKQEPRTIKVEYVKPEEQKPVEPTRINPVIGNEYQIIDGEAVEVEPSLYEQAKKTVKEYKEWIYSLDAEDLTIEQWAMIANDDRLENDATIARIRAEERAKWLMSEPFK